MTQEEARHVVAAVAGTLRIMAEQTASDPDREDLLGRAVQVEEHLSGMACCPVCEEVTCDAGCPLAAVRAEIESGSR